MTTIRRATAEDVPRIVEMGQSFHQSTGYKDIIALDPQRVGSAASSLIETPDGCLLVAERDGSIIGMLALYAYVHLMSGQRCVSELAWWVEPAARSDGAGVRLLVAGEAWAREIGARSIQMIAPTEPVASLYHRRGYAEVERAFQLEL